MDTLTDNTYVYAIATATVAISAIAVFWLNKTAKRNIIPTNWTAVGKVRNIIIYPIKSGHRKELEVASCTKHGLIELDTKPKKLYPLRDRNFILYKEDTKQSFQHSKIFLIETHAHNEEHVVLKAPGIDPITVKIPDSDMTTCKQVSRRFSSEKLNINDCGDEVAKWLSQFILGKESGLRMGYGNGEKKRTITDVVKPVLKFYPRLSTGIAGVYSYISSYHLINQASVDDINSRVAENITANNFRPNIVIEGARAFAEDDWEWIKIGDTIFDCTMPGFRCYVTTYDPDTAKRHQSHEPLKTLKTYRLVEDTSPIFKSHPKLGIHLGMFNDGGTISIGDTVYAGKC